MGNKNITYYNKELEQFKIIPQVNLDGFYSLHYLTKKCFGVEVFETSVNPFELLVGGVILLYKMGDKI